MKTDPYQEIVRYLHEEQGIKVERLGPDSRILDDLGVDGDDAAELIEHLHTRFQTDFAALGDHWLEYFNHEGMSLRGCFWMIASFGVAAALSIPISILLRLSEAMSIALMITLWISVIFAIGRLPTKRRQKAITIKQLAEAVQNGAWHHESQL